MVGYLPGAILRAPDGANNDTASALQWCNARDFLPSIRHNLDRFDIQHWNELFLVVYCSLYGIADLEIKCSQKNPWLVTKRADVKRNLQGWVALGRPALSSRWWSSCRQLGNVSREMTQWHSPFRRRRAWSPQPPSSSSPQSSVKVSSSLFVCKFHHGLQCN